MKKEKKELFNSLTHTQTTLKNKKAITLIALIITIIVIIILASIAINLSLGNNGIFNKSKYAKKEYLNSADKEQNDLNELYGQLFVAENGTVTMSMEQLETFVNNKIDEKISSGLTNPVGTIIAYSVSSVPNGYLKCSGQAISRTQYKALFDVIGTTYGAGDGSTTFNIPNLQGEFLRGAGINTHTNQGNGSAVGTHQDATRIPTYLLNKNGTVSIYANSDENSNINNYDKSWLNGTMLAKKINPDSDFTSTTTAQVNVGTVRPTNTSVLYCIKY